MKRILFCVAGALLLVGCSSNQAFVVAETTDTGALTALIAYEKLPTKNEAVVQKVLADQAVVDTALLPAEAQVAAGEPVTNTAAINGAIAALVADEAANGVAKPSSGSN
jgi:PBP1b-binding outer membrane lipoprotein LpoB